MADLKKKRFVAFESEIEIRDKNGNLVTFVDGKRVVHKEEKE